MILCLLTRHPVHVLPVDQLLFTAQRASITLLLQPPRHGLIVSARDTRRRLLHQPLQLSRPIPTVTPKRSIEALQLLLLVLHMAGRLALLLPMGLMVWIRE